MENQEILNLIEKFARANYIPVMLEPSCEFLSNLCKEKNPKNILEIGTAIGYSGTIMLESAKESKLTTIEKLETSYEMAKVNFEKLGVIDRVKMYLGDAYDIIQKLPQNTYDFIFLDGPKGQYIKYLPILLKLLKVGGTLVADNVLYKGMVEKEGIPPKKPRTIVVNLRKFLKEIVNDKNLETNVYHIGDGISVSLKKGE